MILPEDIINNYPFESNEQLDKLKTFLINYYNGATLKKYKECNEFLYEQEIYAKMPNKIIEFYTTNNTSNTKNTANTTVSNKVKNPEAWEDKFEEFIKDNYVVSLTPDTKFKDIMIDFNESSGITVKQNWGKDYEALCNKLNIKYEKIVDPRYKGSSGTCYLFLKSPLALPSTKIDKKFHSLIPDIPTKTISIPIIPKKV